MPTPAAPAGDRSPIILASVGVNSGPAAATMAPNLWGAQVWVKHVNQKGGLNGHPVQLIVYDDAFDAARHNAALQDAVERRRVHAFVSMFAPVHSQRNVDYLTSKRVPVIGSFGGMLGFYASPMYFPQQSHAPYLYRSWLLSVAQQLQQAKKSKLGIVYCAETPLCTDIANTFKEGAKAAGMNVVSSAQASIAQPDYTAECLAARNAGAEGMVTILDGNAIGRYSSSCARQGWKPNYAIVASIILDRHAEDPNLDGTIGVTNVMPWFATGTPATDEFQLALKTYGASLGNGVGHMTGWAAGKILEKAAAGLAVPSSEALLRGLWSIKGDNFGGLVSPLTFNENEPSKPATCWWNVQVKGGRWVSPDALTPHCEGNAK